MTRDTKWLLLLLCALLVNARRAKYTALLTGPREEIWGIIVNVDAFLLRALICACNTLWRINRAC